MLGGKLSWTESLSWCHLWFLLLFRTLAITLGPLDNPGYFLYLQASWLANSIPPAISCFIFILTQGHFFIAFRGRQRGKEGERESRREREISVREKHLLVTSHMLPDQRLNLQPRYLPWLRIEPATFRCTGRWSKQANHTSQGSTCNFNSLFAMESSMFTDSGTLFYLPHMGPVSAESAWEQGTGWGHTQVKRDPCVQAGLSRPGRPWALASPESLDAHCFKWSCLKVISFTFVF